MQFLPVVDRPVEVELLAQFDLPLLEHRLGGENQNALGFARQPGLTQHQAGLNGFAQAHFIGDQQPGRPSVVHPLKGADLVRPGLHGAGGFANALAAVGQRRGAVEETPDDLARVVDSLTFLIPLLRKEGWRVSAGVVGR